MLKSLLYFQCMFRLSGHGRSYFYKLVISFYPLSQLTSDNFDFLMNRQNILSFIYAFIGQQVKSCSLQMEVNIPYGPLYTGEQSISSVKDNAVVIIGITREGKTCVYNKIAKKTMIGKVVEDTVCYVPNVQTSTNISYGQMSNSLGSVTFEPNITHLSSVTSLIDLAGKGQTRSPAYLMTISYFLSKLIQRLKKVKFILVFSSGMATSNNPNQKIETLNSFLSLFNFNSMSQVVKEELFKSVSFVVTRATQPSDFYSKLFGRVGQNIQKDTNFNIVANKPLVVELLKSVAAGKRVYSFLQAQEGRLSSSQPDILQKLGETGWQFVDLPSLSAKFKDFMVLPLQGDFKKLKEEDQVRFKDNLTNKIKSILKDCVKLVENYFQGLISNWKQAKETHGQNAALFQAHAFSSQKFIKQLDSFLLKNYLYSELREKQSHNVPQSYSSSVLLVSVIGSVLKMKELVAKEDVDSEGSQHLKIVRLYQKFEKLVSHIWVANRESSKLTKVAFVVQRVVQLSLMFSNIFREMLSDLEFDLKDWMDKILEYATIYLKAVMGTLDFPLFRLLLPTIGDIQEFQKLADAYMNPKPLAHVWSQQQSSINTFLKISLGQAKFNLSLNQEPLDSLLVGISLLRNIMTVRKDRQNKILLLKKTNCINEIASIIVRLDPALFPNKNSIALQLSELTGHRQIIQNLYVEVFQESAPNSPTSYELRYKYCKFLLRWGRIDDAVRELWKQESVCRQSEDWKGYKRAQDEQQNIIRNKERILKEYYLLLGSAEQPMDQQTDKYVLQLCSSFETISSQLSARTSFFLTNVNKYTRAKEEQKKRQVEMTERRIEETRLSQMQNERAKTELILVLLARAEKAKRQRERDDKMKSELQPIPLNLNSENQRGVEPKPLTERPSSRYESSRYESSKPAKQNK